LVIAAYFTENSIKFRPIYWLSSCPSAKKARNLILWPRSYIIPASYSAGHGLKSWSRDQLI
jgi:hypothetical protein